MEKKRNIEPKAGVQHTGAFSSEESHLAWTSMYFNPEYTASDKSRKQREIEEREHQKKFGILGSMLTNAQDANLDIWQSINPGTWFNTNPQQAIQTMLNLKKGEEVIAFDFETLGTFGGDPKKGQLDFGTVTEMAFGRYRLNDQLLPEHVGSVNVDKNGRRTFAQSEYGKNALSLLLTPNQNTQARISQLISKVEGMGRRWSGLTADERRTLNDLILYSDSKNLKKIHGMTFIMGQNRQAQALDGSIFTQDHIASMKKGFENLKKGTNAEQLAMGLDKFFYGTGTGGLKKMAGFNTQNFDVPVFQDFLSNHILPQLSRSSKARGAVNRMMNDLRNVQNVDLYQAVSVVNKNLRDVVGPSGKQHNIAKHLGIQFTDAHFGLDDLQLSMDIWHKLGNNFAENIHNSNGLSTHRRTTWNQDTIKPGMELFSVAGMKSGDMSPFDMVFKKTKKGFEPAYSGNFSPNPIYKNTRYTVEKMVNNLEYGGQKFSGVMLYNQDDDLYHFISNTDEHKLRNTFQQSFKPLSQMSEIEMLEGRGFSQWDRTRRRWDKMYGEGGVDMMERMLKGLDALEEGRARWGGRKGADKQIAHYVQSAMSHNYGKGVQKGTKEMYRDLLLMEDRLSAEAPYLREFVGAVRANSDISGSRYLQGVAATAFKNNLDALAGRNISSVSRGAHVPLVGGFNIDGYDGFSINLRNQSTIEASLRSMVNFGGKASVETTRRRLSSLLGQLQDKGVYRNTKESAQRLNAQQTMIKHLSSKGLEGEDAYMVLRELSADIEKEHKLQHIMGVTHTVDVDDPTKLVSDRAAALDRYKDTHGKQVVQEAIQTSRLFSTQGWSGGKFNTSGTPLKSLVESHQNQFKTMMQVTGVDKRGFGASNAMDSLSRLANAYKTGDTEVAYIVSELSGKHKTLHMVVANKNDAEQIFKLQPNEIIESNKVAAIPIPMFDDNMNLVMPGKKGPMIKQGRLTAMNIGGKVGIGTGFDAAVQKLINMSGYAKDVFATGNMVKAGQVLGSASKDAITNLSMRNLNRNMSDFDDWMQGKESNARMWNLQGMLDVSGFAEEWYTFASKGDSRKDIERVRKKMKSSPGMDFIDAMSGGEQLEFQRGIDSYLQGNYGVRTHAHSAKDTYVSNYIRSTRDIRELTPMGLMNPMARENLMKSINYKTMDTEGLRGRLAAAGKTPEEIERYLKRGFVTDVGANVVEQGDKTAYLNVRSAHMSSTQIADIVNGDPAIQQMLKDAGIDPSRLSTYDGTYIVRQSVASAFETTREKRIKFEEKHLLDDRIKHLFEGMSANDAGEIMFGKGNEVDLKQLMGGSNLQQDPGKYTGHKDAQKITVGWLERGKHMQDALTVSNPNQNIYIKGFNQKTSELILETRESALTTTKMVTDTGERVTQGLALPDHIMDKLAGKADAIFEETKLSRNQIGSELYKSIGVVIDEARRMNDEGKKITVGDLKGQDALQVAEMLMKKHLNMNESLHLQNDQFVLSSVFGIKNNVGMRDVGQFLAEAADTLGIDGEDLGISYSKKANGRYTVGDSKRGISYGQVGLGIGDVYNWEKSIAAVDDFSDGLTNWGVKEVDVILAKANRTLQGPNAGKQAVVKEWLTDHMDQAIKAQGGGIHESGIKGYKAGLSSVARHLDGQGVPDGFGVIRTKGNQFESGRTVDGRYEVSMNMFEDIPEITSKGQTRTVGDYQKTIIQAGQVDADFNELMKKNNGVFFMEMPDGNFDKKYVPMIDTSLSAIPGLDDAMLNDLQKSQSGLWRKMREYQNLDPSASKESHDRALRALQGQVTSHEDTVRKAIASSRDGGLMKKGMTAKMDMAGQFRVQGVNPMLNKGNYEEGNVYVSKQRMLEMIGGAERNIGEQVFDMKFNKDTKIEDIRSQVLAKIQNNGLYGFTNRYPTIDEDTVQALNVRIDDTLGEGDRGAYVTVGTAMRLKADYDGDFLSIVMAQYKGKYAGAMHEAMGAMHAVDKERFDDTSQMIMQDLAKEANKRGVTVGSMMANGEFMKMYQDEVVTRVRGIDDMETLQARMGKMYVGSFDNTRHKMIQLAKDTYSIIGSNHEQLGGMFGNTADEVQANLMDRQRRVAEFGRMLSQDTISAKKWSIANTREQVLSEVDDDTKARLLGDNRMMENAIMVKMNQRVEALDMMQRGIRRLDDQGMRDILTANEVLGLFKTDAEFDKELGKVRGHSEYPAQAKEGLLGQKYKLSEMLGAVKELYDTNGEHAWLDNVSLRMGVSEGPSSKDVTNLMNLEGQGQIIMTDWMRNIEEEAFGGDTELGKRLTEARQQRANAVIWRLRNQGGISESTILSRPSSMTDSMLSGSTVAENTGARMSDLASQLMGGGGVGRMGAVAGWGAALFGGMWATSALMRSGPTPEGTDAQEMERLQGMPVPKNTMGGPTARVTPQSENINIQINAKDAKNMNQEEVTALVQQELNAMMNMDMNMNLNVSDNSQNIDREWLQGIVANAVNKGFAF